MDKMDDMIDFFFKIIDEYIFEKTYKEVLKRLIKEKYETIKKNEIEIPILCYGTDEKNKIVIKMLIDANIHCNFIGIFGNMETPELYFKGKQYIGIDAIKLFIERQKNK